MTIRRAERRDAFALAELAERTFRDAFAARNTPGDMDLHCRSSYGEELQAREIADRDRTTLVCEHADGLVAYGQLRWGPPPPGVLGTKPAEIQRLYVDSKWHGRGIAQALMAALLDTARAGGADTVWLGVWEHNPRAIAFYRKIGFVEVGAQTFVLGRDPQRDLVLELTLDRP